MPANNKSLFPPSVLASATALRDAARSTRSNSLASQQRSDAASIASSSLWSVDVDAPEMPKLLTSQNFARQGAQRSPLVVHVEPPIQSAHASIEQPFVPADEPEVFEPQSPVDFEHPAQHLRRLQGSLFTTNRFAALGPSTSAHTTQSLRSQSSDIHNPAPMIVQTFPDDLGHHYAKV